MCRMIVAVGRFDMVDLVGALRLMAANANVTHSHEFRAEGRRFIHDCGWGAALLENGSLSVHRSASSCLVDSRLDALAGEREGMVLLHARRTPDRGTISVINSHPFSAEYLGRTWVCCHNGTVRDTSQFSQAPGLAPEGTTDSEGLFHHVLARMDVDRVEHEEAPMDVSRVERSLASTMAGLRDYTCLNCFLTVGDGITIYTRAAADTPRPIYYGMWRGCGSGFTVVSSEPVPWNDVSWDPIPDGEVFSLRHVRPAAD